MDDLADRSFAPSGATSEASADESEIPAAAPPVVAVVVAHEPGAWFEEAIAALAAQDYPALDVLVIDAASTEDPTPRVAAILPQAYVRRIDANPGFGPAANEVLGVVEGAAFYLICHDDVALEPDALRTMVEEAYRSNAGIVGPKLVQWDDCHRLLQVGMGADKTGVSAPLVERGELDQEQHDAVRDVFYIPGGCMLVRADLFAALGGFDTGIDLLGEDLDFCWRAQVAGARVMVAPGAVVRHIEALGSRREVDDRRRLQARHRLRTMLTCYGPFHLARVLPQAAFMTAAEVAYAIPAGRFSHAGEVIDAWLWNGRRSTELRARRRQVRAFRQVPDHEVRRLQVRGSARLSAYLRGQIGRGDDRIKSVSAASRELAGSLRSGRHRVTVGVLAAIALVLAVGSRFLITKGVPAITDLPRFPSSPLLLLREWVSGWRSAGLGSTAPAPTAFGFLGVLGFATFAQLGFLRTLLVVGMLPVGLLGAWRLLRPLGSQRARLAGVLVFAAIPVPYNAIATGHWGGLVTWATAPWAFGILAAASGVEPFAPPGARRPLWRAALGLGVLVALAAAIQPFAAVVVLVVGVGLAVGSLVAAEPRAAFRMVATAVVGVAVAAVLHLPWSLEVLHPGRLWSSFGAPTSTSAALDLGHLLRFETGPIGAAPLGWAFLVVAALPLLIGRDWRFAWAVRAWTVALACWAVAWAGEQTWLSHALPGTESLLGFAAVALALNAALGLAAFQNDLRGYRFGWRQAASVVAAAAAVAGLVPVAGSALNGRWHAPSTGYDSVFSFLGTEQQKDGPFRVLWVGDPAVLPLASWPLEDGLGYATTDTGSPTVEARWSGSDTGPTHLLAADIHLAEARSTGRLGRLLAPMGVRYVVLPGAPAPTMNPSGALPSPPPDALVNALAGQLDLVEVEVNPAVRVYRNTAWAPTRAVVDPGDLGAADPGRSGYFRAATDADLAGSEPALRDEHGYLRATGQLPSGSVMYLGSAADPGWHVSVAGHTAPRTRAFGWANQFAVDEGGAAELSFRTPFTRYLLLFGQAVLWLIAIQVLRRMRAGEKTAARKAAA